MRGVLMTLAAVGVLLHLLATPMTPGCLARTREAAPATTVGAVGTSTRAPGALPIGSVERSRGDREGSRAGAGPPNALPPISREAPSARSEAAHDEPVTWSNRDPIPAGVIFDPRDLRVLADLIEANRLDESSSATDFDNGDGVLEPLEVGSQVWRNGRLVAFATGADRYDSFGYGLTVLPPSLGDLDALEELDLQTNRVAVLPDSIAELHQLQVLRLHRNGLQTLTASIGALSNLRELSIGENAIETLPVEVVGLAALEELHANDNPLAKLPEEIGLLPRLRVLNVSHAEPADPLHEAAASDVGLVDLPRSIENAPALETLLLAGNHLFCAGSTADPGAAPARLRDGSIPGLSGLASQVCGGQRTR
jgi:hypothetical protein